MQVFGTVSVIATWVLNTKKIHDTMSREYGVLTILNFFYKNVKIVKNHGCVYLLNVISVHS